MKTFFFHGALSSPMSGAFLNIHHEMDMGFKYDITSQTADVIFQSALNYVKAHAKKEPEIVLVGHSWGGIIACTIARRLKIKCRVITISTPYGGSDAASMLRYVKPFSTFIANIASNGQVMKSFAQSKIACPTLTIVSTAGSNGIMSDDNDGVVSIKSQLAVNDTSNFVQYAEIKLNHFEVLLSMEVVNYIKVFCNQ